MTDEELLKITDSIQEKLGDNAGVIADDIGLLITGNSNSQKALVAKDEEIKRLTSTTLTKRTVTNVGIFVLCFGGNTA